ncbi:MAG: DUF3108 domain-containing protein [Thiomargarita sp.]|nr:DUF3108 domain-containing protein [Thiomargarita sp.]
MKNGIKQVVVGFCMLLIYTTVIADSFLPLFTAQYKLYAKGVSAGEGTRSLTRLKNGYYQFKTVAKTTGFAAMLYDMHIEERSIFAHLKNGEFRPLKYYYSQTGKKSRSSTLIFDWAKGIAINTFKGQTRKIPLKKNVIDKLLYQVLLMVEQKKGKRHIKYSVADKGKIKTYIPQYLGIEHLKIGNKKLKTVKYERTSSNGKRRTILWCAPNLHYLPVQVEHIEKGDVFRLVLQSVKWF